MQINHTINDATIYVQINYENTYYETNIENNIINKSLIENNNFMFRQCDNILIMYDDDNKFMLDKMECNYSDYIEIKNQLELEMEINQLKTQLYESNITLQKQTKEINQLNKKLGEEQICHYLTKKLCILPRN